MTDDLIKHKTVNSNKPYTVSCYEISRFDPGITEISLTVRVEGSANSIWISDSILSDFKIRSDDMIKPQIVNNYLYMISDSHI